MKTKFGLSVLWKVGVNAAIVIYDAVVFYLRSDILFLEVW